jgi:hypothetical protein
MYEDLLKRYDEALAKGSRPKERDPSTSRNDQQKAEEQKYKIDNLHDAIRGVCVLNYHASREHRAHIIQRLHFKGRLMDDAWEYLLSWVDMITEGLDEKYEYWNREWYVACTSMELEDD